MWEHGQPRNISSYPQLGQNLYVSTGSLDISDAVFQWHDEIKDYDFERSSGRGTGHFTQVVWRDSRQVGVGRAQAADGKWLVVANYLPAGNFIGRYAENVLPLGDGTVKPDARAPVSDRVTSEHDNR